MVSRINDSFDVSESSDNLELLKYSGAEDDVIAKIFSLNSNYKNDLDYTTVPAVGKAEYNSNSYHSGLLDAAGINRPSFLTIPNGYAGCDNPVPAGEFQ